MEKKTLKQIRNRQGLTAECLSRSMRMTTSGVFMVESRRNPCPNTLRNYLHAMGFDLKLVAVYPYGEFEIILPEKENK